MKTKGMNFIEAVRQAKSTGCEIRRDHWGSNVRIVSNERGEMMLTNDSSPYHHVCGILADDWEIAKESAMSEQPQHPELLKSQDESKAKTTELTFPEALQAAVDGNKIRRALWREADEESKETFLTLDERSDLIDQEGERYSDAYLPKYRLASMLAVDWEIVPEEKPPAGTMSFKEAMLALLNGKRVKRLNASWVYSFAANDSNLIIDSLNAETDDWIIVEG
jgi:hypothetical protein